MNDPIERFIEACEGYRDRNHRIQWLFERARSGDGFTDEWEEQVGKLTEEMHAHLATISHLAGDVASVVSRAGEDAKPVFALVREAKQNDIYNFGRLWCTSDVLPILRIAAAGRQAPESSDDGPWVPVRLGDLELNRKWVKDHADDPARPFIRWVARGKYEIRQSKLREYLRRPLWEKFGV